MRSVFLLSLLAASSALSASPRDPGVESDSPAMVFSRVSGAVVLIRAETARGTSQGSGVIVGLGQVVTNLHVVEGAQKIVVVFRGKEQQATVASTSKRERDLALLAVDTTGGSRVALRRSKELVVGERVFAIGNPRGYEQTLTDGLVSALRKDGDAFVVQTSAAISPGSSGGGLFDSRGRLVGITTKTRTDGQSLNFANPAEWVEDLLKGKASGETTAVAPRFTVSERPEAARCELKEAARWGMFSEGLELLESSAASGTVVLTKLAGTQPTLGQGDARSPLVLKDLSRKAQVALFRGEAETPAVFVSFEESGDIRATLAWVVTERNEPRLVTRSGLCEPTTAAELKKRRQQEAPPADQGDVCEHDAERCYQGARLAQGGERFLFLKKACLLGQPLACDEAIALARGVGDTVNAQSLRDIRATMRAQAGELKDAAPPSPEASDAGVEKKPGRRPLRAAP